MHEFLLLAWVRNPSFSGAFRNFYKNVTETIGTALSLNSIYAF